MKIIYFKDTDTLYLELNKSGVETMDCNENALLDLDEEGNIVSITIEHASTQTDIKNIKFSGITV